MKQEYPAKLIRRIPPADISSAKVRGSIRKEDFIVFSKALEAGLQKYLHKESSISVRGLNQVVENALNKSSAKQSIRAIVLDRVAEKSNSSKLLLSYLYSYLLCNKNQRVIKI